MRSMKKILVAGIALAVSAGVAQAAISVTFGTGASTIHRNDASDMPINSMMMVYWSLDNSSSGFNSADPTSPTGGDVLLTSSGWSISAGPPLAGRITGHTGESFGTGTTDYSPGYLYIAVFDMLQADFSGSFTNGTWYGLGPVYGSLTQQYPTPATVDNYGGSVVDITTSSQVLVPEPGTLAFALLGLGAIMIRRKLRK